MLSEFQDPKSRPLYRWGWSEFEAINFALEENGICRASLKFSHEGLCRHSWVGRAFELGHYVSLGLEGV